LQVTVRYFAALREALGPFETLEVPASLSVGDLRRLLVARGGAHAELLAADRPVRCALAQRMVDDTAALQPGAEVAFFPPVTGG
jgi:sulfur-carrier protein